MEQSICIFGASSTQGFYDAEQGGWADRLKTFLFKKVLDTDDYYEVFNLGISGDTTRELVKRFDNEIKFRRPTIIIISIGDNDSVLGVSLDEFEANISKMISSAKKAKAKIVILGCKYVNEKLTNPLEWDKSLIYLNKEIAKYDNVLKKLAKQDKLSYIEMFDLLEDADLEDGLHPNSSGHKKIFERVKDFLLNKNWI